MGDKLGDAIGPALRRSFDDTPVHLKGVPRVINRLTDKKSRDRDGVTGIDHYDGPHHDISRSPNPDHPGRDRRGRYNGDGNTPWIDKERLGLDKVAADLGVTIHRDKVRATIDGHRKPGASADRPRYFDGLFQNSDGTYTGVEIKSGGGSRDVDQRTFDGKVSPDSPATAVLNGERIQIVDVYLETVP